MSKPTDEPLRRGDVFHFAPDARDGTCDRCGEPRFVRASPAMQGPRVVGLYLYLICPNDHVHASRFAEPIAEGQDVATFRPEGLREEPSS